MKKLALAATLFAALAPAVTPSIAGSPGKFDGNWSVSVVTEKGDCDAYTWTIVVSDNQLRRIESAFISASGAIDARGQARFQVASVVTASGQMNTATGRGHWEAPSKSCSGRWQAARI